MKKNTPLWCEDCRFVSFETGLEKPMLTLNDPNGFKNTTNVYSIHLELRMASPCQISTGKWKYVNPCLDFLGVPDQRTAYVKRQARPRWTYVRRSSVTPDLITCSCFVCFVASNIQIFIAYISGDHPEYLSLYFYLRLYMYVLLCIFFSCGRLLHIELLTEQLYPEPTGVFHQMDFRSVPLKLKHGSAIYPSILLLPDTGLEKNPGGLNRTGTNRLRPQSHRWRHGLKCVIVIWVKHWAVSSLHHVWLKCHSLLMLEPATKLRCIFIRTFRAKVIDLLFGGQSLANLRWSVCWYK